LRSDYRFAPAGTQAHTHGMALWIPYYGTGVWAVSDYAIRSHWCPWLGVGPNENAGKPDWTNYLRMIAELRRAAPYFSGDYYPLTPYSLDETAWMAWQFDRPDLGEGLVQAFRRAESYYESARFPLGGLEADARYNVTDLDSGRSEEHSGRELTTQGLKVSPEKRASAIVLLYKKVVPRATR
jgi:alpha-galactosidase